MVRALVVWSCLLIGLTLTLQAGPIAPGTWYEFSFTDAGDPAVGCDPADPAGNFCIPSSGTPTVFADAPPWTITLLFGGSFLITDAFESGDIFEVFDFGVSIGVTSGFTPETDCGDDPAVCIANPGMSSGSFSLSAGDHSLTIVPQSSPFGGGSGYFTVAAAIPEPNIGIFIASGLALLICSRTIQRRGQRRS